MKTVSLILLTLVLLSATPLSLFAAQNAQPALVIRFADGVEIQVADWIFEYEYGTSDKPVTGFSFYTPSYHKTKDLMIAISKTERGITFTDERVLHPNELKSMKFEYSNDSRLAKITVHLSSGEVIAVDQLTPPKKLLTKANYIFEQKLTLKGTAVVNNKKGAFSKMFDEKDIKERIVAIDFGGR